MQAGISKPYTRDEVYRAVKEVLVDSLGVEEDEVTPGATLMGDLGAESIDFLDIAFRLEKRFKVFIPRFEMGLRRQLGADPDARLSLSEFGEKMLVLHLERVSGASINDLYALLRVKNMSGLLLEWRKVVEIFPAAGSYTVGDVAELMVRHLNDPTPKPGYWTRV